MIETGRLLLRPLAAEHLDALVAIHADPEVARFMSPFAPDGARERLQLDRESWQERGYGLMAIIDRATGVVIGRSGLRYWPELGETEVGWVIRRDLWGRGLGGEAGLASAAWGFGNFELPYLTAMIDPVNVRSLGIAKRLGMTPLREQLLFGVSLVVHAVTEEEWTAAGSDRARAERGRTPAPPPPRAGAPHVP